MVAVGDVYELAITVTDAAAATQMINVFHLRQKAGFTSAINIIGDWKAAVETEHRLCLSNSVAITKYACFSLIPHGTDAYEATYSLTGTAGVGTAPAVCAAIITWRTGFPGRRKRGRTYIGGFPISMHVGGRLAAGYIASNLNGFGNKVVSVFGAGGSSLTTEIGVWSRVLGGQTPPHDPAGFTVINGFTAQPAIGTMGTRRFGRGI